MTKILEISRETFGRIWSHGIHSNLKTAAGRCWRNIYFSSWLQAGIPRIWLGSWSASLTLGALLPLTLRKERSRPNSGLGWEEVSRVRAKATMETENSTTCKWGNRLQIMEELENKLFLEVVKCNCTKV